MNSRIQFTSRTLYFSQDPQYIMANRLDPVPTSYLEIRVALLTAWPPTDWHIGQSSWKFKLWMIVKGKAASPSWSLETLFKGGRSWQSLLVEETELQLGSGPRWGFPQADVGMNLLSVYQMQRTDSSLHKFLLSQSSWFPSRIQHHLS